MRSIKHSSALLFLAVLLAGAPQLLKAHGDCIEETATGFEIVSSCGYPCSHMEICCNDWCNGEANVAYWDCLQAGTPPSAYDGECRCTGEGG